MQWSRVKSILIVILLVVDVFLLGVLGKNILSNRQRQIEMTEHLQIVLEDCGVSWGEQMELPTAAMIPQLNIDRSPTDELRVAYALLGEDAVKVDGNGDLRLESDIGEVVWSDAGMLHISKVKLKNKKE